jgi:DNA-directed RNA polymerase subunit RPC12/RpoP
MTSDVGGIDLAVICKPREGFPTSRKPCNLQQLIDDDLTNTVVASIVAPIEQLNHQSHQIASDIDNDIVSDNQVNKCDDIDDNKNEIRTVIESLGECQRCNSKKIMIEDSYLVCDECGNNIFVIHQTKKINKSNLFLIRLDIY